LKEAREVAVVTSDTGWKTVPRIIMLMMIFTDHEKQLYMWASGQNSDTNIRLAIRVQLCLCAASPRWRHHRMLYM